MKMPALLSAALLSLIALTGCQQQSEPPEGAQPETPADAPESMPPPSSPDDTSGQMGEPSQMPPPDQEQPPAEPPKTPSG